MLVFGRGEEEGVVDPKNIFLVDPRGEERREERKGKEGREWENMCFYVIWGRKCEGVVNQIMFISTW